MPTSRRIARLEQLILETVAVAIQRDVHDPRVGMITVTRVHLAPDLSTATVWWSSLGDEGEKRTTTRGLEAARSLLQSKVAQTMGTRVTPTLTLRFDAGLEKAHRLETIFDQIRSERGEPVIGPEQAAADAAAEASGEQAEDAVDAAPEKPPEPSDDDTDR